jgi:hypothetical protein
MTAVVMIVSSVSTPSPAMNDRSIFRACAGNRLRYASDE